MGADRRTGILAIVGAALLWGSLGPVARVALRGGVEPLELAMWRALIAGALFAGHAALRGRVRPGWREVPGLVVFALCGVSGLFFCYMQAVKSGGAALAAVLLYTAPAWVAVAGVMWLGERLGPRKLAAVALTVGGVAVVALGRGGGARVAAPALGWGLASGLAYAGYYLYGKRVFARHEAPTIFMYAMPLGGLALLPVARPGAAHGAEAWLAIAWLGVVPTYLSYLLYSIGLRRLEASQAATIATLEPVVAAVLATVFWGERLGALGVTGAAAVLAGVLLASGER